MRNSLVFLLTLLMAVGCSTKKDFPERIFDLFEKQAKNFTDGMGIVEERVDNQAKLPEKFNLAIYFKSGQGKKENWKWSQDDKDKVFASMESFKGIRIGRVFELLKTADRSDYTSLRRMAAQQGADALLLVQGIVEVDSKLNPWAVSYVALVPMLFVPGNNVSSAFISQAILWNVRRSYVHLGVQSEGDWSMKRPAAFRQQDRAITKSREESVDALALKLKKNFQEVLL